MAVVGFVPHPQRPHAAKLAEGASAWLESAGHAARILCVPSADDLRGEMRPELVEGLDLAVSLGGDGTMLRTVDLVAAAGVPVLGVNVGHLGYLSGVEPDGLIDALGRFLAGEYALEERMTLDIRVVPADGADTLSRSPVLALNDVVLQRTVAGHTVHIEVSVSGVPFLTYAADSLIVATPTGSTAYNLSARGPIVSPGLRVVVLTPVAAHMLFDRALVFGADEPLDLVLDSRPAELVVDGRILGVLEAGGRVECRAGRHDARLINFGVRDFHQVLKQKFGLADR
jgi:NAD+ kinase